MDHDKLIASLQQIRAIVDDALGNAGDQIKSARKAGSKKTHQTPKATSQPTQFDFAVNERAFVKTYAHSLSGPKKFVLIVAYLAKGQIGKEVDAKDVQQHWNKMKSSNLLGCKFNHFYTNAAKENGWVDSKKKGAYVLTKAWQEAVRK